MICVVTGAGSGIGRALVDDLAGQGHRVVAVVRPGSATRPKGSDVREADLSVRTSVERLARSLRADLPGVDLLVHAAGVADLVPLEHVTAASLDEHMAVNLGAVVQITIGLRDRLAAARGVVVTFSSEQARMPTSTNLAYGASKAALEHASRSLASALGPDGVRVCCLSLGGIDTPMLQRYLGRDVPPANALGRRGTPAEVVDAVHFVVGNPHLTGGVIPLDGGAHLS